MMRPILIIAAIAWLAAAHSVSAGLADAAKSPVASAPADIKPADPRAAAAVDKLLSVTGVANQMNALGPQIIDALLPALVRANVGKEQEIEAILREQFLSIFAGLTPDLVAHARSVYLAHFSADELEAIIAFYESPVGLKMTSETPAITREMFAYGQQAGRAAVAGAMPRIIDRMRAANLAVPAGT
ncbi:DUF2059 domain-containing protein [Rhizorhabdus dicambivorans]|uniref:DUF2059 domain-containing protein n=1 Tax=Rhizorhabdus dicambivorans TaxID=1850238 RepID=A0A2A4FUC7_9SPHN|nr:DUF2059 domain-containing protein [Rhizorhabdus dicambivorans]ATE65658.1 DUF2059 domain-containing protein [Rhizorhabdus dicambivorans]PCE41001.1 DUF2059 domain-containing protein [Rhizorhabdus dicambivorans]